jgi:hypothetical protein
MKEEMSPVIRPKQTIEEIPEEPIDFTDAVVDMNQEYIS